MKYLVRTCSADLKMSRIPASKGVPVEADSPVMAATIAQDVGDLWIPEEHGCKSDERLLAAVVWPEDSPTNAVNVYFPLAWKNKLE